MNPVQIASSSRYVPRFRAENKDGDKPAGQTFWQPHPSRLKKPPTTKIGRALQKVYHWMNPKAAYTLKEEKLDQILTQINQFLDAGKVTVENRYPTISTHKSTTEQIEYQGTGHETVTVDGKRYVFNKNQVYYPAKTVYKQTYDSYYRRYQNTSEVERTLPARWDHKLTLTRNEPFKLEIIVDVGNGKVSLFHGEQNVKLESDNAAVLKLGHKVLSRFNTLLKSQLKKSNREDAKKAAEQRAEAARLADEKWRTENKALDTYLAGLKKALESQQIQLNQTFSVLTDLESETKKIYHQFNPVSLTINGRTYSFESDYHRRAETKWGYNGTETTHHYTHQYRLKTTEGSPTINLVWDQGKVSFEDGTVFMARGGLFKPSQVKGLMQRLIKHLKFLQQISELRSEAMEEEKIAKLSL